jgi:hypothetical protein
MNEITGEAWQRDPDIHICFIPNYEDSWVDILVWANWVSV